MATSSTIRPPATSSSSAPPRIVEGVSMVGAGDTFGVAMAMQLGRGADAAAAAAAATDRVIGMLEGPAILGHGPSSILLGAAVGGRDPAAEAPEPALDGEAGATDLGDRAAATEGEGDVEDP